MNIYEKMLKISSEIQEINKNIVIRKGENQYKAVSEDDVTAPVKELELKYGIYSFPFSREIIESNIESIEKRYESKSTTVMQVFLRIQTIYRFVNIEKPDEFVDIIAFGDGIDTGDKAPGKAMTYSDKYALMKAYKIIASDEETKPKRETATKKQIEILLKSYKGENLNKLLKANKISKIEDIPKIKASELIEKLTK